MNELMQQEHKLVQESKIPSIESFKMILEFMFIHKTQFNPLLSLTIGENFYLAHIQQNKQFRKHWFHKTQKFYVTIHTPDKDFAWVPSYEVMDQLTQKELTMLRLEAFKFTRILGWICSLTFVFTGGIDCPRSETTYKSSPDM